MKFFNTTGPCDPDYHYMLQPEARLVGAQLHRYIKDRLYWVLHAPRQTGKTTFLQSWMRKINAGGETVACYVSVERCQGFTEPNDAMPLMVEAIRRWAERCETPMTKLCQWANENAVSASVNSDSNANNEAFIGGRRIDF